MSSLKRKHNLLDDKQKREIISYAKEIPKLTQQQIADNLTIKWDLFILMSLYKVIAKLPTAQKVFIYRLFGVEYIFNYSCRCSYTDCLV